MTEPTPKPDVQSDSPRFRAKVIEPEAPERHVVLPVVKGGKFAEGAEHDAALLWPDDGCYEDVRMRVFGNGTGIEFRFSAETMREALKLVEELRRA